MRARHDGFLLFAAVVLLYLCSMCSPLYPINIWDDANCLLTVGRAMKHGAVLYRDIYEQKGSLLYGIHMLAAYLHETSFLGVFVLEIVAWTATLMLAARTMVLRTGAWMATACAVLFGACAMVGRSFARGDSAEEFCLPLLMAAVYLLSAQRERTDGALSSGKMFVCGLCAGCVAMIKYTALGLFIGLCLAQAWACFKCGGVARVLSRAGAFLAGMLVPALPWVIYFVANNAGKDAITAYFYNNIFLYQTQERTAMDLLRDVLDAGRRNVLWALPAALGTLYAAWRRQWALPVAALAAAAAVFLPGKVYPYYPLVLCVFAPLGFREAGRWLEQRGLPVRAAAGGLVTVALAIALLCSPNAFLRGVPLEETAQGKLAARIEPGASLLQYSHLDDGLYLATGILPDQKYFVRLNVDYAPMQEALDEAILEERADYVLVSWRELPLGNYELIAHECGYDDENRLNKDLYLYRRRTL